MSDVKKNSIEVEGKTYEEAVQKALDELGVSPKRISIELINSGEGKRLLFLKQKVKIRVTVNAEIIEEDKTEKVKFLLNKVLNHMHIDHHINDIRESHEKIFVDLNSKDEGIMIGKQGRTINSLQHLINIIYNKENQLKKRIVLDVGKYRKRREEMLKTMAVKYAKKVKETQEDLVLDPLPAEDRKVIHKALDQDGTIRSFSKGQGEYRSIVITKVVLPK